MSAFTDSFFYSHSLDLTMNEEQRVNLKFLVKFGKTAIESLKVYGDDTTSQPRAFEWHKQKCESCAQILSDEQKNNRVNACKYHGRNQL